MSDASLHASPELPAPSRRDFLFIATGAFAAVGTAAVVWPLISQMSPDAQTIAAGAPFDVDISSVAPGQQISVLWRGHPVFIVNRPAAALATLKDAALIANFARSGFVGAAAAALRPQLASLARSAMVRRGRRLHPSRLHSAVRAQQGPAGPGLARRLFLPLPRLEIRPRRPGLSKMCRRLTTCRCRLIAWSTPRRCASAKIHRARLFPLTRSSSSDRGGKPVRRPDFPGG